MDSPTTSLPPCLSLPSLTAHEKQRPSSKRVRAEVEDGQVPKPRLPSCLVGATPEITSSALQARGNQHGGGAGLTVAALGEETDPHRLRQRQKQIDYGKNTLGYDRYIQQVPKERRRRTDPRTPDIHARISTKRFNGLVRAWRRRLHEFDPQDSTVGASSSSPSSFSSSLSLTSPSSTVGAPTYAAVVVAKTPGSCHDRSNTILSRNGEGMHGRKPVVDDGVDGSGSDGDGEEIINTQQGGPGSTGGKGRDKKKSRVTTPRGGGGQPRLGAGADTAKREEESDCVENDFPALEREPDVGMIDGDEGAGMELEGGDFYEIKRSTAMGAGMEASSDSNVAGVSTQRMEEDDEEVCYSDDDLL